MIKLKKAVSTLFIILWLVFSFSLTKWILYVKASPNIIHVGIPTGYSSIQEAINNANSGDTIFVHNGTYYEDVVANKSISLIGENRDLTIIGGYRAQNIIVVTAENVSIEGFTIKKIGTIPYTGIRVVSKNIIIRNNKISDVSEGVLIASVNNVISQNIISNTSSGASIYFSINNVFSDNLISNNSMGLSVYFSSNNVFSDNTISHNSEGVSFYFSNENNILYHNNFFDTVQLSSESANVWSYNGEGNYWHNYTGPDFDEDGIGDAPYTIDMNNEDSYPLMGMFSEFDAALGRETYTVTIISNSTVSNFRFKVGEETGNKIIQFDVTSGYDTVGFCRVAIPSELMSVPFIIFDSEGESIPFSLGNQSMINAYLLYFAYNHSTQTITLISSKILYLYNQLFEEYPKLQADLYDLNVTYHDLLNNYIAILSNYSQLQQNYLSLNLSYHEHLVDFSENMQNLQNLIYIFAVSTAIFLITTVYLAKRVRAGVRTETVIVEDEID